MPFRSIVQSICPYLLLLSISSLAFSESVYVADAFQPGRDGSPRILAIDLANGDRSIVSGLIIRTPQFLALDPVTGDYLVTDQGETATAHGDEAVWRFNPVSAKASIVSGLGIGAGPIWREPRGIVISPAGHIYVADDGLNAIVRVNPVTGERTIVSDDDIGGGSPSSFRTINSLALLADGALAVTNSGTFETSIIRVDPTTGLRSFLSRTGRVGGGPDLGIPVALAVDHNNQLIVASRGPLAVLRVNPANGDRGIITDNTNPTYSGPQVRDPAGLAVDTDGSILLTDHTQNFVLRVLPSGERQTVSGNPADPGEIRGAGPALSTPNGLLLDRDGNYILAEQDLHRLVRVSRVSGDRSFVLSSYAGGGPLLERPRGLTIAAGGRSLLVVDHYVEPAIVKIDLATGNRTIISGRSVGSGVTLSNPQRITIDRSGQAIYTDSARHSLVRVNLLTGLRQLISSSEAASRRGTGDAIAPYGVTSAADGYVYVTNDDRVVRIDPVSGNRLAFTPSGLDPAGAVSIAAGSGNRLYFCDWSREAVYELNTVTGVGRIVSGQPPSPDKGSGIRLQDPYGLVVKEDGTLLVIDTALRSLFRIDPATGNRTIISGSNPGDGISVGVGPWLEQPIDLTLGSARAEVFNWERYQ